MYYTETVMPGTEKQNKKEYNLCFMFTYQKENILRRFLTVTHPMGQTLDSKPS